MNEANSLDLRLNASANIVAGAAGGLLSLMVGHPLDTVKVRLQTMSACPTTGLHPYTGVSDCVRQILTRDGFLGLYRGMGGMVYFALPRFALIFHANALGKRVYGCCFETKPTTLDLREVLFAGLFSQLWIVPGLVTPLERIKVLMQTNNPIQYTSQWHCLQHLVRHHGLRGLYRGLALTYLRDMFSFGTYFLTYEILKHRWSPDPSQPTPLGVALMAGGTAGVAGWGVAIPADTIKNRHQASLSQGSSWNSIGTLFRTEGVRGFYRGAQAILIRAFPANAATFLGYELAMDLMERKIHFP